jgi:Fe-S-cluster containining protein
MSDECNRLCGGRCCESFHVSSSPEEIGAYYVESCARIIAGEARAIDWERVLVAEMLVREDEPDEAFVRYTCTHLQANGLCGIYETRPLMCREFPGYGRGTRCNSCGFTQPLPPSRRLLAVNPVS